MKNLKPSIFYFLLFIHLSLNAQNEWGGRAGISFQFGTHINRLGLMYQLYGYNPYAQVSHGSYLYFNFKSLGPKGAYIELKMQFGIQGHWVGKDEVSYQFNEFSNMSPYRNCVGYSFNIYLDRKEMSQTTGALHFSVDQFSMAIDNDAFGLNQIDDKYRTGGFYIAYQVDSFQMGLQSTLWTGKSAEAPRVNDAEYPSRFGYRDIEQAKYGRQSHGIAAVRIDYVGPYNQNLRAEVGMDAERIRHLIQNKLIHDGISGRLVKSESPHYPMIQKDGSMYLFRESDDIKPTKFYFQLSANQPTFY